MAEDGRRITPFNRRPRQSGDGSRKPADPYAEARTSINAAQILVGSGNRLNYRQARRISALFTQVAGVEIPAAHLRDIASGAPSTFEEYVDIVFAATAIEIQQTRRQPRIGQRYSVQAAIAATMALGSLGVMLGTLVTLMFLAASGRQ